MRANPRGPKEVLAKDCVATAPLPACAHGTTAPTAGNFDATATPQACSSRSQATMENVIKAPGGDYIVMQIGSLMLRFLLKDSPFQAMKKARRSFNQRALHFRLADHSPRRMMDYFTFSGASNT